MELTEQQHGALIKVLNIAIARTAAALLELTEQRVLLDIPQVIIQPIGALAGALATDMPGDIVTIHQTLAGPVAGGVQLLLSQDAAMTLVSGLTNEPAPLPRLTESAREVLAEFGTMLLNALMDALAHLLEVHASFAVPRLYVAQLPMLLGSLADSRAETHHALVVHTTMRLGESTVNGYTIIALNVAALDHLLQALEQLG